LASADSLVADLPLLVFRARVATDLLEHLPRVEACVAGVTASGLETAREALGALANAAQALANEVRRRDRR